MFEGRIALVTGAASGIGAATAERLAAEGATVIATDIAPAGLAALAERSSVETALLDVSSADNWTSVVADVIARHGRVDIAFLNAGIMTRPASMEMFTDVADCLTLEGYRRIAGINADGAALGVISLLPHMEHTGGDIVITASVAGLVPFVDDPFYGMTKHAMVGFGRALGPALASRGIRVNVLCPGGTDTGILAPDQRAARAFWSPASYIADAVVTILTSQGTGEAWVAYRQGRAPYRYEFEPVRERTVANEAVPILVSSNLAAALARYETMGFTVTPYVEDGHMIYAFLQLGSAHLHVSHVRKVPRESFVSAYLYVTDADQLHAKWSAVEPLGRHVAPTDTPYGLREGAYIDPDGNLLRYGSPLPQL